jgi:hypothetical protein
MRAGFTVGKPTWLIILICPIVIVSADNLRAQIKFPVNAKVWTTTNVESSHISPAEQPPERSTISEQIGQSSQLRESANSHEQEIYAREIQEIRRQMNHGRGEPLADLLGDPKQAEQQFAEVLKREIVNDFPRSGHLQDGPVPLPPQEHLLSSNPAPPYGTQRQNPVARPIQTQAHWVESAQFHEYPNRMGENRLDSLPQNRSQQFENHPRQFHGGNVNSHRFSDQGFSHPRHSQLPGVQDPQIKNNLRSAARKLEDMAAQLEELQLYEEADQARQLAMNIWRKARNQSSPGRESR